MDIQQHQFKIAHVIDGDVRALIEPAELDAYLVNATAEVLEAAKPARRAEGKPRKVTE